MIAHRVEKNAFKLTPQRRDSTITLVTPLS
jgi:hypothetical protein